MITELSRHAGRPRAHAIAGLTAALLAISAGRVSADRREASLHAHLIGAFVSAGDEASADAGTGPMGGVAVRASFATRDSFQYDAALSFLAGTTSFDQGSFTAPEQAPIAGPFTLSTQAVRLDGGVTLRLGVVWIPTVRVAAGLQARHRGTPTVKVGDLEITDEKRTGRAGDFLLAAVAVADIGLDHRVNRRLIVGFAAGASYAVPLGGEAFRTLEVTAHASYYWYPR